MRLEGEGLRLRSVGRTPRHELRGPIADVRLRRLGSATIGVLRRTSTSRRAYLRASESSGGPCWPGCSTPTARSAATGCACSSRSRTSACVDDVCELRRSSLGLPVRPVRQARRRAHRGFLDLLDGDVHDRRPGLRARRASSSPTRSGRRGRTRASAHRFITSVEPIEQRSGALHPGRPPDAPVPRGRRMIPTHNSTCRTRHRPVGVDQARPCVGDLLARDEPQRDHHASAVGRGARAAAAHAQRARCARTTGPSSRDDGRVSEAPLFIDDSPNMSLMEIRAKCRRLKQRHDLKLVVIDYLQLMSSGKRVESPSAGGLRVLPSAQAARQGARGAGDRDLAAEPWPRAAHRQEARR